MPNTATVIDETTATAAAPQAPVLDEFGRDASERTVELTPADAEAVDQEVTAGNHATYDGALHSIIKRGLAEIKRTRDAAAANRDRKALQAERDLYAEMLKRNPALITDPTFVAKMVASLGVVKA